MLCFHTLQSLGLWEEGSAMSDVALPGPIFKSMILADLYSITFHPVHQILSWGAWIWLKQRHGQVKQNLWGLPCIFSCSSICQRQRAAELLTTWQVGESWNTFKVRCIAHACIFLHRIFLEKTCPTLCSSCFLTHQSINADIWAILVGIAAHVCAHVHRGLSFWTARWSQELRLFCRPVKNLETSQKSSELVRTLLPNRNTWGNLASLFLSCALSC